MRLTESFNEITGRLSIRVIDREGNIVLDDTGQNMIVASGYKAAAEAVSGVEGAVITKIGVGTNGTPPTVKDTTLANPFITDIRSVEYPTDNVVRFNFTIPYFSPANGMNISEYGLMTKDGRLFARRVREGVAKTPFLMILGEWEIKM